MEFIISQGETKRKIEGPFLLCASRADFCQLIEQITQQVILSEKKFAYGWIKIRAPFPVQPVPNQSPEPWAKEREG